jgi:TRAP-type C4-dicarboxylate transport system permease small subunit
MEVTMDGDREMENPLSILEWLTGWTIIFGSCLLFWLGVYRLVLN